MLVPALVPAVGVALVAGAGLVGWDLAALSRRPAPRLRRELPDRAHVGRPARLALVVDHRGETPLRGRLQEELPPDLVPCGPPPAEVRVAPRARAAVPFEVRPGRRGDRTLGRPLLLERSPLGFLARRTLGPGGDVLRVFPDTSRLVHAARMDPRELRALLGVKRTRRRGEGMEFESLRDYVPGDDPRRIDWRATARRDRPV
ncbi:MAG: DUF58 domain-containing protein, partial [Myxococcota bacterium]|nr:DUF58 domain-containing protein [Myxococcota bacterium]